MHDKVTSGRPINFTVADAFPHLESALGKCEIEDSFELSITCENTQVPQSSLAFYLQRLARENNLSAIVILNGISLCFVGKNDYLIALDSHPHNFQGAMVAQTKMGNRQELLTALKVFLSPQFNTCSNICFLCIEFHNSTAAHMYVRHFSSELPVVDDTIQID